MKTISSINIFDLRYERASPEYKYFEKLESDFVKKYELGYICIPTNGLVNSGGLAIMGAGLAKDAATRFPRLEEQLGRLLTNFGNQVFRFKKERLFIFPTKNDWRKPSSLSIIQKSCRQLKALVYVHNIHAPIYLPKVGCGLGGLRWENVKPILNQELNSEQYIVIE